MVNREDDVGALVTLQAKAFYEPWDSAWIDNFFLQLFEVSAGLPSFAGLTCADQKLMCKTCSNALHVCMLAHRQMFEV